MKYKNYDVHHLMLGFIRLFVQANGYAPGVRELADLMGFKSTSVVRHHLVQMKAAGLVTWENGKSRTLRVVERKSA